MPEIGDILEMLAIGLGGGAAGAVSGSTKNPGFLQSYLGTFDTINRRRDEVAREDRDSARAVIELALKSGNKTLFQSDAGLAMVQQAGLPEESIKVLLEEAGQQEMILGAKRTQAGRAEAQEKAQAEALATLTSQQERETAALGGAPAVLRTREFEKERVAKEASEERQFERGAALQREIQKAEQAFIREGRAEDLIQAQNKAAEARWQFDLQHAENVAQGTVSRSIALRQMELFEDESRARMAVTLSGVADPKSFRAFLGDLSKDADRMSKLNARIAGKNPPSDEAISGEIDAVNAIAVERILGAIGSKAVTPDQVDSLIKYGLYVKTASGVTPYGAALTGGDKIETDLSEVLARLKIDPEAEKRAEETLAGERKTDQDLANELAKSQGKAPPFTGRVGVEPMLSAEAPMPPERGLFAPIAPIGPASLSTLGSSKLRRRSMRELRQRQDQLAHLLRLRGLKVPRRVELEPDAR